MSHGRESGRDDEVLENQGLFSCSSSSIKRGSEKPLRSSLPLQAGLQQPFFGDACGLVRTGYRTQGTRRRRATAASPSNA
mmetsp:Transcript_20609/g.78983  ORF Transcript_20609/g.78983 Transcript_20609/m.78983 type:complete len:80 (-) Transcript_20609:1029-1268(-)